MSNPSGPQDDPRASSTLVVAVVGALLVFVTVVGVEAYFYNSQEAERVAKVDSEVPEELARLRAQQQEQLNSYRWIDQARGTVVLPIDRAMELVVHDPQWSLPAATQAVKAGGGK